MSKADIESAAYLRWISEILETHSNQLWDAAGGESDDEELGESWSALPEQLRRRLWGLSADLFSLVDNEKFADADYERVSEQELARRLKKAFDGGLWDELLVLLRLPPRPFAKDLISYIRGRAWQELGQYHVALMFFDNASRLKPGHAPYRILALECLKAVENWREAINRANQYASEPSSPPALLFRAGDVFHSYLMEAGGNEAELAQKGVDLVDKGLSRLAQPGADQPLESTLVAAFFTKASCLERLGRFDEALSTYGEAIQRFPKNPELLTARGLFGLEHNKGLPIEDMRTAVELAARTVWPYMELARNQFLGQKYDETIRLCRLGLERASRDSDAALLFHLLALALFEKNHSEAAVGRAFDTALSLDPFNSAIQHNYERFLVVSKHPEQETGGNWEFSSVPIEEEKRVLYQSVQASSRIAA